MATKYSDIVNLRGQKAAYNIINEPQNAWKSFIANEQFIGILRKVVASVRNNDIDMHKSFWISGTYGTGKSHAGAVIKHILCDPIDEIQEYVDEEFADQQYAVLRNSIYELRKQKRLFPVMLYAQESISHLEDLSLKLQQKIITALRAAGITLSVKSDFENYIDHIQKQPQFWDNLIAGNGKLKSIAPNREKLISDLRNADTSTLEKVRDALRDGQYDIRMPNENLPQWFFEVQKELAENTEYDGLLVIWDEFTDVMTSALCMKILIILQELDEQVMNSDNNSYFLYISHPSAFDALNTDERKKTEGRYHLMHYNMEPVSAFKIMTRKFKVEEGNRTAYDNLYQKFYSTHSELLDIYSRSSTDPEETKMNILHLFPLHPSTANLATYYAREAGSSNRSVFQFLGENTAISNFLNDENHYKNLDTITADYLWDYVIEEFNNNTPKFGVVTERFNSRKLEVESMGNEYFAVFKSILLLNALNNIANNETVTPSEKNIYNLFVGTSIESHLADILDTFDSKGIIQRQPGGLFSIQFSALPTSEIEDIKKELTTNEYKYTSQVVNFGDTIEKEITTHFRQVARPTSFKLYSLDANEYTLLNKIENGLRDAKPYEIFIAMLFAQNSNELYALKQIAQKACCEERFKNIVFVVFDSVFGEKNYERFIEFQANAKCALNHGYADQKKNHTDNASKMLSEWMKEIKRGNFTYFIKSQQDVGTAARLNTTINSCIAPLLFEHGIESLDIIKTRSSKTYWQKVSAKQVVDTVLSYNTKTDICSRCTGQSAHIQFLLQDSVDENLEWKSDIDPNHPLWLVYKFIKGKFDHIDKSQTFHLDEKLADLQNPPFGLYQSYAGMGMVAFAMRKYANQIYDYNGKPRSEQLLIDDVVELFKAWESGKKSNKLEFRFETKDSRNVCKNLIDLFHLKAQKGYNDVSSLTDARWAITNNFLPTVGYPLWSLKYLDFSILKHEEIKELVDCIEEICRTTDTRKPALLEKTLDLMNLYNFELGNLLNNFNNEFEQGFCNFLKAQTSVGMSDEEFESAHEYLSKGLQREIGSWDEDEVISKLKDWRMEMNRPKEATITTNVTPVGSGTVYGGGTFNIGSKISLDAVPEAGYEFSGWVNGSKEKHIELTISDDTVFTACFTKKMVCVPSEKKSFAKEKIESITDLQVAKDILIKVIDKGNEFIINIINEA